MKKILIFVSALVFAMLFVAVMTARVGSTEPQPKTAFDHSNCQYPDRWSNPVDGCDNSDPAVPECIKSFSTKESEDACIAEFAKANQPLQIIDTPIVAPAEPTECGGK